MGETPLLIVETMNAIAQFGTAGLMGTLWIWERYLSRRRECQLTETHNRLTKQQEQLGALVKLIHHNTHAIERFDQTQNKLIHLLEQIQREIENAIPNRNAG